MSADNYLHVRKRPDGKFGISMRFASSYYRDEIDPDNPPLAEAKYTGTAPVDDFGFAPIPDDWIHDPPEDRYGIYDNANEALREAHHQEIEDYTEYGVSVGEGVLL